MLMLLLMLSPSLTASSTYTCLASFLPASSTHTCLASFLPDASCKAQACDVNLMTVSSSLTDATLTIAKLLGPHAPKYQHTL